MDNISDAEQWAISPSLLWLMVWTGGLLAELTHDSGPGGMAYIKHPVYACMRDWQAEAALGAFVIVQFTPSWAPPASTICVASGKAALELANLMEKLDAYDAK